MISKSRSARIAWDLRAGELVEGDLESALREYVEEWSERARVPVEYECRGLGDERLPAPVEAALYRVAQEALANVEKHAAARRVSVLLEREAALVRLLWRRTAAGLTWTPSRSRPRPRNGWACWA